MRTLLALLIGSALALATLSAATQHVLASGERESTYRPFGQILLLSGAWLLANRPFEGRTLIEVGERHGMTVADLLIVPPLLVAAALALIRLRSGEVA